MLQVYSFQGLSRFVDFDIGQVWPLTWNKSNLYFLGAPDQHLKESHKKMDNIQNVSVGPLLRKGTGISFI